MARRKVSQFIVPKTPSAVLEKARTRVETAKDEWARRTVEGFMRKWNDWYSNFVVPQLIRLRLPKRTESIRDNVINRVVPVCEVISKASANYRAEQRSAIMIQAPVTPV